MDTKENLVKNIKEWIKIDSEIIDFKNEIKKRTNNKKKLTEDLVSIMKNNNIDCVDINGGQILYKKSIIKKPINSKTLLKVIQDYYKNDKTVAEDLTKHILENREEQLKETIKRKMDK
jgi:hypothetical protein